MCHAPGVTRVVTVDEDQEWSPPPREKYYPTVEEYKSEQKWRTMTYRDAGRHDLIGFRESRWQ